MKQEHTVVIKTVQCDSRSFFLLMMPDAERSEYPDGFSNATLSGESSVWSPLLLFCRWTRRALGGSGDSPTQQTADSRHRSLLLGCYHGNPRRKLVVGLLVLLSSSYISPDLHSHSRHSLISLLSLHVEQVALPRISHLKAHYIQSACFYPFLCAQGRLSVARHLAWWEQRDGQRADRGGGEVCFNQLQSQSRFFMVNLRVLYVQRKPGGLWIIWKSSVDTEARLINLVLLKLPVCVEYKVTPACSSQRQSSFLMFDLIMRLILDVTAD